MGNTIYRFDVPGNKRKERQHRLGREITPSSGDVAAAVIGKHISRAEARNLNFNYVQHLGETAVKPEKEFKERKPKAPKAPKTSKPKKKKAAVTGKILVGTRVVNGKEFKVYEVAPDIGAESRHRKAEKAATRTIYRPKSIKY